MFANHGLGHLPPVLLATCRPPVPVYAPLQINSSTSQRAQYPKHTFVSFCPKPFPIFV